MAGPHMMPIIELRPHYDVAGKWESTGASEGSGDLTSGQIEVNQNTARLVKDNVWFNPPAADSDVIVTMRMFFSGIGEFGLPETRTRLQAYDDERGYVMAIDERFPPDFLDPNDLWDRIFLFGGTDTGPPCGNMQPWELTKTIDKDFWNANFTPGKFISFQVTLPREEESEICSPDSWFELLLTFEPSFDFEFVPSNDAPAILTWVTTTKVPLASNGNMRFVFAEQRYDPVTGTYVTVMRSNNKVFYGGLGTGISGSSVSQTRIEYRPTIVRYETNSPCTPL